MEEVKQLAKAALEAVKVGMPSQDETTLGPIITEKQYQNVKSDLTKEPNWSLEDLVIPMVWKVDIS